MADKYGAPDWSKYRPNVPRETLFDLAELAARLGSPVTYDRRGAVMYMDTFEGTLNSWLMTGITPPAKVETQTDDVFSGHRSVEMLNDASGTDTVRFSKSIPVFAANRCGFEFVFKVGSNLSNFLMDFGVDTGTRHRTLRLQVDVANDSVLVLDSASVMKEVATPNLSPSGTQYWQAVKIVADFDADTYVRLLFNNVEVDISEHATINNPGTKSPRIFTNFSLKGSDAVNQQLFLGGVIITVDES